MGSVEELAGSFVSVNLAVVGGTDVAVADIWMRVRVLRIMGVAVNPVGVSAGGVIAGKVRLGMMI